MIRFLKHGEIDRDAWDLCISSSLHGSFEALTDVLDIVSPGWEALVQDDYSAVMPLTWRRKYGIKYLYTPFFISRLGVFGQGISQPLLSEFLKAIPNEIKFAEYKLNEFNGKPTDLYNSEQRTFQVLDLRRDYKTISSGFSENLIRNLRKASGQNLRIAGTGCPDVVDMFRSGRGDVLEQFDDKDYERLLNMIHRLKEKGAGFARGAFNPEGKLLAAAFFPHSHGRITYLKGGITEQGKSSGAMHYLLDHVISENAGKADVFDFGGSNVPSVARFNKSFGADDHYYYELKINRLPFFLKWFKR